ncbi:hypothetical protein RA210_U250034 [Rubrivivax sp. A210]|nr:hypothetical protein RA210_U250034 [Rubrivivax sp. A210]
MPTAFPRMPKRSSSSGRAATSARATHWRRRARRLMWSTSCATAGGPRTSIRLHCSCEATRAGLQCACEQPNPHAARHGTRCPFDAEGRNQPPGAAPPRNGADSDRGAGVPQTGHGRSEVDSAIGRISRKSPQSEHR